MKDKKVTIRIRLDSIALRLFVLALLPLVLGGPVASAEERGTATETGTQTPLLQAASARSYYLTTFLYDGDTASLYCATGYHMASLWEILDVSNLTYRTSLGYQHPAGDCGQGPPAGVQGWVRTGYTSSGGVSPAGRANCLAWTSDEGADYGTVVSLPSFWSAPSSTVGVWEVAADQCSDAYRVWCVED